MNKQNEGAGYAGREGIGLAISAREGSGIAEGIGGAISREGWDG